MPPRSNLQQLKPLWQTTDGETVRLYHGNVTDVLARLPARSVQCVVTSPPYWGLRDYGTGTWEGGDTSCDHARPLGDNSKSTLDTTGHSQSAEGKARSMTRQLTPYKNQCGKCGARRTDMQIGSEPSPDCGTHGKAQCGGCFVCSLVGVFREVRRVLRDDGVVWLNLGDTYAGGCGGGNVFSGGRTDGRETRDGLNVKFREGIGDNDPARVGMRELRKKVSSNLPGGNLVGAPWRVALALQADGWVLRHDVIWAKPSPMPESVTNRCTKAHEYVFMLTKSMDYYCDMEAIKEKLVGKPHAPQNKKLDDSRNDHDQMEKVWGANGTSNKRSVWTISSEGYPGAHFATFPSKLAETCVLAGTSQGGACKACGRPADRLTREVPLIRDRLNEYVKRVGAEGTGNSCANTVAGVEVETIGWDLGCACGYKAGSRPCVVLDPFMGSGTTAAVCVRLGRWCWGIDLSDKYILDHQVARVEGVVRADVGMARGRLLPPRVVEVYRVAPVVVGRVVGGNGKKK